MKKPIIILSSILLLWIMSCNKRTPNTPTLPKLNGSWTLVGSVDGQTILTTSTGLVAYDGYPAQQVSYSSDHGVTWNVVFSKIPPPYQNGYVLVDAVNSSRLILFSVVDSNLYQSTNGGQSWNLLNHPTNPVPYLETLIGNRLFAATPESNSDTEYIEKSNDFGNTWDTVFPFGLWGNVYFIDGSLKIFAGNQVLNSIDSGNTWASSGISSTYSFIGQTSDGSFIGSAYYGVGRSKDTCRTWTSIFSTDNYSVGSGIAFDSCVLVYATYENASLICCNPNKGIWYAANVGLQGGTSIFFDNQYVYVTVPSSNSNYWILNIYRRPRSDFAGL